MLWLFSPGSQVPPTPPHPKFSIFVFFLHTNFFGCHVGRPQVLSLIIFFSYKSCVFVCLLFVCLLSSLFCIFFFAFIQLKHTVTLSKHSGGSLWLQMTQNLGSHYLFITQSSHIWEEDICTMVKRNVHNRNQPLMTKSNSYL